MISSIANPQIKHLVRLQKKARFRKEEGAFVIEGSKMFEEAQKENRVRKAYFSESYWKEKASEYKNLEGTEYEIVTDALLREVSDTMAPQGVIAIVEMPHYNIEELLHREEVSLLILEDIRDPGNLGTIVRTAEGAGIDGIVLSRESVDMFNPKVIRSTMGSLYRMPFLYVDSLKEYLINLKKNGIVIYAAHLEGGNEYDKEIYAKKAGFIIGNEANGITEETAALADCFVRIPMAGQVESLNAAIAAALFMYQLYGQRRK